MPKKRYMQLALDQATKAVGRTSPNPPVGAVVVQGDTVVGLGFHPGAGQPHAEIFALQAAGSRASGATLYVTLEPCHHHGRTGPCTEAVIAAGIKKVVIGVLDPNPLVAGSGAEALRQAGVEVLTGLLEDDCRRLIAPFGKHITTGLPFVTLKMAMTLDGQTATSAGESQWISGEESRQHVHRMRDRVDAIMVGVGTVLADNPALTTRLPDGGKDPIRIVIDTGLRTPPTANLFSSGSSAPTLIVTASNPDQKKCDLLESAGAEIIGVPTVNGRIDLNEMMAVLGRRNIQSVLLEGGATLAAAALRSKVVDRAAVFIAPKFFGGDDGAGVLSGPGCRRLNDAVQLKDIRVAKIGDDILIEGEIA